MAVNKVVYGTTVLVDLTEDTVTPQTLLLGNRAHGADGQIVNGTLTGSQTGVLVAIKNIPCTYSSGTSVTIDIHSRTAIYSEITADQIIVEFTHLGFYASGLVFGGTIDSDISVSYNPGTGIITLTADASVFRSGNTPTANVYITEQPPVAPKTAQSKSVTPSAEAITVTPDAGCELESVSVEPVTAALVSSLDSDFKAANILAGVNILGLTGTLQPEGGSFSPDPWDDIEIGTIVPSAATSTFSADLSRGTPMGMIISLANKNGIASANNALVNACWANSPSQAVQAKGESYYSTSSNTSTTGNYPTYNNGAWNLNRSLRAGWTYFYCIVYSK